MGYIESKYPVLGSGVQLTTPSIGKPGYGRGMCQNHKLKDDERKGERKLHDGRRGVQLKKYVCH